jgi:hypothetical protein
MAGEFWLSEAQWGAIGPLLPKNQPGARRTDDRRVISGKACSMGLRSGEYFGRNTRRAPNVPNCLPHRPSLVGAEIVEDHDVACLQRRHEELFDIGV